MSNEPKKVPGPKAWSLGVGVFVICISLWALHRFCDGYSESTRYPQTARGNIQVEDFIEIPAESVCSRQLGVITLIGAFGVVCLSGAWVLQFLGGSHFLLLLSTALTVVGRLVGGFGVVCLAGAWVLQWLVRSQPVFLLSTALAVVGRLIALGSLGTVALVIVLFNLF